VQTVRVQQIRGSESRSRDFDADFHPLREFNRFRWISVAAARLDGLSLAAVELIQIGDEYYVRDGHHRVSVARALGELYIEARVTVWCTAVAALPAQPAPATSIIDTVRRWLGRTPARACL
jgi:hypothetical protein